MTKAELSDIAALVAERDMYKQRDHDHANRAGRAEMTLQSVVMAADADFTLKTLLGDMYDEMTRVLAERNPTSPHA